MYGTNIGDNQNLGNQALGNGTATYCDYPFYDGYTYPYTVLPQGHHDLSTPHSVERLEVPIQSIEQHTNHGQFNDSLQAAADAQAYEDTARMDSKHRAGSGNSQALQSATPDPFFNKPEQKKRKSSSAAPPGGNKRRRTSEEDKSKEEQLDSPNFPESKSIDNNPNEKFAEGSAGPRGKSKEKKTQPEPVKTIKSKTPTSNNAQEKRKLDAAPPSTNKRRRKSDDKTPEPPAKDVLGAALKDNVATSVVFVSPENQLDQANMTAKAREVGVHSAVALFRPPTEASKKYSRKSSHWIT